ncbi:MAG: calcium-translocating P-type ATPase, PMCA-type [Bacilli bacterium]|nr:calcium-translocating P-type ATPase, PMCA-type [Bacilli bacterium]
MNRIGLDDKEVTKSREKYGSNEITVKKQNGFITLFIESLGEPMTKILLIALAIKTLFLLHDFDWYETVGIAIAIFIASFISTISEYGSEAAFKKLQAEASKIKCKTFRNGGIKEISIGEVVKNDVLLLQAGDKIPADGILIEGDLYVDESALNGESKESKKNVTKKDLLRGSIVCSGEGKMLVTSVGDHTVYGKIGLELQDNQRDSPLKLRLRMLAHWISKVGYVGAFLVAFSYLLHVIVIKNNFNYVFIKATVSNLPLLISYVLHAVTLAVTVIVVAVPEGLPMMITLVLSRNMKKMLKDNILVRKLLGIETSGSLNILFTDKTGTLTKGKLQVVNFIDGYAKDHDARIINKNNKLIQLLNISLFYNNGAKRDNKTGNIIGSNATDRALLEFASYHDNGSIYVNKKLPFDSQKKISAVTIDGEIKTSLVKGMPEKIIDNCSYYYDEHGQKQRLLGKGSIYRKIELLATKGIRFIAIATSDSKLEDPLFLKNLSLVGIVGLRDEVRSGVPEAIKEVEKAGIQVVMITGDAKNTATAIADEVGLINKNSIVLTSEELGRLSDDAIREKLPRISVVARALPSDKSRLVKLSQELNLVVGMTGDGVNDAPAIKKADVGFAMGSGTEVAKEAADIVILDNNFLSITKTILYGRTIFKSIRKFIILQLTINICAVGLSIIGPFIGIEDPITIIQMLWINMIMDTFAALAFAGEPPLKEYMQEKPKKRDENILNKYMINQIVFTGMYSLILCILFLKLPFFAHLLVGGYGDLYLLTGFFALFIFMGIFNCFNARTHRLNLLAYLFKNRDFVIIISIIVVIQTIILYFGGSLFRVIELNVGELITVLLIAFTVIPADWMRKLYLRFKGEKGGV